jgi:hypothetical protein
VPAYHHYQFLRRAQTGATGLNASNPGLSVIAVGACLGGAR